MPYIKEWAGGPSSATQMSATTTCQWEIVDHGVDAALGLHDRELINDLLRGTDTAQAGTESNPLWGDNAALCQDKGTPKISRSTTIGFFSPGFAVNAQRHGPLPYEIHRDQNRPAATAELRKQPAQKLVKKDWSSWDNNTNQI